MRARASFVCAAPIWPSSSRAESRRKRRSSGLRCGCSRIARMRASVRLLFLLTFVSLAGCGPAVDLTKGLQANIISSGWFDAGIVNGQNKLVPIITFTLKNLSDQKLMTLQINAIFRRVNENDEWGSAFMPVVGSEGLPPSADTQT